MGLSNWIVIILVVSTSILLAREKAAKPSVATLSIFSGVVLVGLIVLYRRDKRQLHLQRWDLHAHEVNDSVYELQRPVGKPIMQVVFFHGLPFEDFSATHLSTWESEDGSCLWPKTWLGESFPNAQILVVSYNNCLGRGLAGSFDMYNIGENLTSDLIQANIGQKPHCSVVLVGHSFGGLVIKKICMQAHQTGNSKIDGDRVKKFFDAIRGIFYYSTPHHGSPHIGRSANVLDSPLIKYFTVLSTEAERLNFEFNRLCGSYPTWQIKGLGESLPVKSGLFRGVVVVPEASARGGDIFNVERADHFSISKPDKKTSRRFTALKGLLHDIENNPTVERSHLKEEVKIQDTKRALEGARPHNFQRLPEQMKGLEFLLQQVKVKLEKSKKLGFVGMGGLGKTTLVKAVFNQFSSMFEYTCFVSDVKLIAGNGKGLKTEVWTYMHCDGKKVGNEEEWFKLRAKKLLLVLDDISTDRDVEVLSDIACDSSAKSRFIVTSRDKELLSSLDDIYEVPFLDEDNARQLFMSHTFPGQATPPLRLKTLVWRIVEKCGGLPLTLEVLGKYLKGKVKDRDWEQTLHALNKAEVVQPLNDRLWEKLRPSYDGLGEKERQIFLDSATFFSSTSWTLQNVKAAWSAAYETESENLLWQTLVDRSLVYDVADYEYIKMHEQLQSLGRKIASESNNNSQSRVWETREALMLLQATDQIDSKEVHAFKCCRFPAGDAHIGSPALCKLKKVQFLEFDARVVIDGRVEVESFPSRIVLLKSVGLNIFIPALLSRLSVLDLDLDEEFLPSSIGQLSALRVLVLSNARCQERMPDEVGRLSKLEYLRLYRWKCLQDLPVTFGKLLNLKHLTFEYCGALHTLPNSFGNLSSLLHLQFSYCGELKALPEFFGQLSALEHLQFHFCEKLGALPESFGKLSALGHLRFLNCWQLGALPKSFGDLSALEHLLFIHCEELKALPESFGNLSRLEHLHFKGCGLLGALPESFGNLSALKHLKFSTCLELQSLPKSFGDLSQLEHLELQSCHTLEALPESFGQLAKLQYLYIESSLWEIEKLPDSLAELMALLISFLSVSVSRASLTTSRACGLCTLWSSGHSPT